jgi:putative transposase
MPRAKRIAAGGVVYHVLNRANGRRTLFQTPSDYQAFMNVCLEAHERVPVRVLAYCIMPNHWHFVLWPREEGHLSEFIGWLTLTHSQRWHAAHNTTGTGHLYQGRFKSLPIQTDSHFLIACRYVERNALRAGLVTRAEEWPWSSLSQQHRAGEGQWNIPLSDWPLPKPGSWRAFVNEPESESELQRLRQSISRGRPFGADPWVLRTANALGLESTLRARGRPKKVSGTFSQTGKGS